MSDHKEHFLMTSLFFGLGILYSLLFTTLTFLLHFFGWGGDVSSFSFSDSSCDSWAFSESADSWAYSDSDSCCCCFCSSQFLWQASLGVVSWGEGLVEINVRWWWALLSECSGVPENTVPQIN